MNDVKSVNPLAFQIWISGNLSYISHALELYITRTFEKDFDPAVLFKTGSFVHSYCGYSFGIYMDRLQYI